MDRKKAVTIDDDEYSFPDDPNQNLQSAAAVAAAVAAAAAEMQNRSSAAPKKGMKGEAKSMKKNDEDDDEPAIVVAVDPEDDKEPVNLVFSGELKKKMMNMAVNPLPLTADSTGKESDKDSPLMPRWQCCSQDESEWLGSDALITGMEQHHHNQSLVDTTSTLISTHGIKAQGYFRIPGVY